MQNNVVAEVLDYEMVHWNEQDLFIAHKANKITYIKNGNKKVLECPADSLGWKKLFIPFRKARRALRIDKIMIVPNSNGFVAVRNGHIYIYNDQTESWSESETRLNCRNPMYNAILNVEGNLYIGEYGKPNGIGKRILMSKDDGYTWECVHQFKPDEIRHIHALLWDKYEQKIWVFTGDFNPEPQVFKTDKEFMNFERVGGGTQEWRSCHALFSEKYVDWMMDCPLEEVHHIRLNRSTNEITVGQAFAGPVWFANQYGDIAFAASAQEVGPSHKDKKLHLYKTNDLLNWQDIAEFEHDGLPKGLFRFGVMTLNRGYRPALSCEGVKHYDGKTVVIRT